MQRRTVLPVLALALGSLLAGCTAHIEPASGVRATSITAAGTPSASASARTLEVAALTGLEHRYGARLGVAAIDTGSGTVIEHRAESRFAFASTGKFLSAALLLRDDSDAQLDAVVHYAAADLQEYSPITSQHVATGMPLRDVIAAALQYSDNTAANLMIDQLGGTAAVQAGVRSLGDDTTNVDRTEPDLNEASPGDTRDTTTPRAMATDLRRVLIGDALPRARRDLLRTTMLGNTTGGPYIRAGVPAAWTVADKTGNGGYGTRNDIGVVYPPGRAPIVVALYSDRGTADATSDDALLADATKVVTAVLR